MHKRGHKKQKYSNRPSISDLSKKDDLKRKDIENLTLHFQEASMQDFVTEASTKPGYDVKMSGTRFVDEYQRENLWKQWKKSGKPQIRQWTKEQFQESGNVFKDPEKKASWHNEPRAFHQRSQRIHQILYGVPKTKKMTIEKGSISDFFAELSHSAQKPSVWEQYQMPKLRKKYGEEVYHMPGNIEYEAHSIIEPKMQKEYWESSPQ